MKHFEWFGAVGSNEPINARRVQQDLASAAGGPIRVSLHSDGGEVFEGLAIYDQLRKYKGRKICTISTAFSIASFVAMAFDEVEIAQNGWLMLHHPSLRAGGTAAELRRDADQLDKMSAQLQQAYLTRSGIATADLENLMASESFIDASQAVDLGFADRVATASDLAAAVANTSRGRLAVARVTRRQPAAKRWERAVANCRSRCRSAAEAVMMANRENPGLRQQMIRESNKR